MKCPVCGAADAACVGPAAPAHAFVRELTEDQTEKEVAVPASKAAPQRPDKAQDHAPTRTRSASADKAVRKRRVADKARVRTADKA